MPSCPRAPGWRSPPRRPLPPRRRARWRTRPPRRCGPCPGSPGSTAPPRAARLPPAGSCATSLRSAPDCRATSTASGRCRSQPNLTARRQRVVHVGRRAGDQVVQRVRRELLLDREHGQITGDLQRGHERRLLDRQVGHPGQALRPAHREHEPVPHVTGADDRGRPVRPGLVVGMHARGQPGGVHQAAGVAEAAAWAPDRVVAASGYPVGSQMTTSAPGRTPASSSHSRARPPPVSAMRKEGVVDLLPSGQRGRLPVDDRLERLAQHVIERRRGGDHHDRETGPVGQLDRRQRHLGEVLVQLDAQARQAVA